MESKKYALIVPTLNPGCMWEKWTGLVNGEISKGIDVLVLDSESEDGTPQKALEAGFEVQKISRDKFDHGGTRQKGVEMYPEAEIFIFLTQDALLADSKALKELVKCFDDPSVGAAYGRQLPHENSEIIAAHARLFNYPAESRIKSLHDSKKLGIKTAFISNSFAAYRRKALKDVGGFPNNTILSEDTYVASKMLLKGWKIAYCAEAKVYHSHNYNFVQEFRRYFDIGVFHSRESWIREKFGHAEGEGLKFVVSEIKYIIEKKRIYLLLSVILRTMLKYIGYRLGMYERKIPNKIKKYFSMNKKFWY